MITKKKKKPFRLRDREPVTYDGEKYWLVSVVLDKLYCLTWDGKEEVMLDCVWTPEGRALTYKNIKMVGDK